MPKGGFRPGGGRPRGVKDSRPRKTRKTKATPVVEAKGGSETGLDYLRRVMNDVTVDAARRDRCALAVAAIENRWQRPMSKRDQAEEGAKVAARGTDWERLLNRPAPAPAVPNTSPWADLLRGRLPAADDPRWSDSSSLDDEK
jgi:hypothetical protein